MVSLNRILNVVIAMMLLSMTSIVSYSYWKAFYQPPIKFLSIAVLTHVIEPGENLIVRITMDRRDNCPGTASFNILRLNDAETLIDRYSQPLTPIALGEAINFIFPVKTPSTIANGIYVLRIATEHRCQRGTYPIYAPEASFRVCRGGSKSCVD